MARVLYSNGTSVTGKQLAQILGIKGSVIPPDTNEDVIIRWGSSVRVPKKANKTYNKRNQVLLATDKLASLKAMRANHVPVPRVFTPQEALNHNGPLLGRQENHTQGKDIVLCLQAADVQRDQTSSSPSVFFTAYVPTSREFRVHVFLNEVIKVSEKLLTNAEHFSCCWIRNFDNGYTFRNMQNIGPRLMQTINDVGIRAVQALGLDFGAVDVILGDDGAVYALEVNTGPSLADKSLELYVEKFAALLGIEPQWPASEELTQEEAEQMNV